MALIVCENCGRKISDTCLRCIHCGKEIETDQSNNAPQDIKENSNSSHNTTEENDVVIQEDNNNFSSLTEKEKGLLEEEFRKSDKWAERYVRKTTEFVKFRKMFYHLLISLIILIAVARLFIGEKGLLLEYLIVNFSFLLVSLVCFVALFIICLGMFLYGVIGPICFMVTLKKYVYLKKFILWLSQEKNIKYAPVFTYKSERRKFEKACSKKGKKNGYYSLSRM